MHLLFDIGGTHTRLALTQDGKKFGQPGIIKTPKKYGEAIKTIQFATEQISRKKKLESAVGGVRGILDRKKGSIFDAHVLKNWSNKPLQKSLEKALGCEVILENDSAIVGLGEAIYGSGRGKKIVAYYTISTGVGGVRIVNGRIDKCSIGFEPGKQIIDFKNNKDIEDFLSGKAIEKKYHKKPYEITSLKFWDEMAKVLAYGLNNAIVHWSPDIFILGGSMMKKIGIPVPRVKYHLSKILEIYPRLPIIKKSALGDLGGLYGALALVKTKSGRYHSN